MISDNKKNNRHPAIFGPSGHFTACMAGLFWLKIIANLGFASGFFEGKPPGKITNNNSSEDN
jgi:hypothetical protein